MKLLVYLSMFQIVGISEIYGQAFTGTSERFVVDTIPVSVYNTYLLSNSFVISPPLVFHNGKQVPDSVIFYEYGKNLLRLDLRYPHSLFDTLYIYYRVQNNLLPQSFVLNTFRLVSSDKPGEFLRQATSNENTGIASIFGNKIERSGSLVRGFTIGSNKDLTLQSGMRLQLSGKLADDIELTAALSDENSPIQPEGNTERLEELDKVYIEVKSSNFKAVFGDYEYKNSIGEFNRINRKFQGFSLFGSLNSLQADIGFASAKGKFNSVSPAALEGVQGPYILTGDAGERDIIVIAGSEKVYLNGTLLVRGEKNDYTIDYGNGQIYFTPQQLISSASRITVEFEYSDRKFTRNFLGATGSSKFFNNKLHAFLSFYREGDDQDSPIDLTLTDEDKKIISDAGNNPLSASRSGVILVSPDSTGKRRGFYLQRDTVVNNTPVPYYLYAPGSDSAIYSIIFSFIGTGKGQYIRERIGVFRFVGLSGGDYSPVQLLPLPEIQYLTVAGVSYFLNQYLFLSAEAGFSLYDRNRLSKLNDDNTNGFASTFKLKLTGLPLPTIFSEQATLAAEIGVKNIKSNFKAFERTNSVEFNREYNTSGFEKNDEMLLEGGLTYSIPSNTTLALQYGLVSSGTDQRTNRIKGSFTRKEAPIFMETGTDYVETRRKSFSTKWLRSKSSLQITMGKVSLPLFAEYENRRELYQFSDSLLGNSNRFIETGGGVSWEPAGAVKLAYSYLFRNEFIPVNTGFIEDSRANGHRFEFQYTGRKIFSTTFSLASRKKDIVSLITQNADRRINALSIRWNGRFAGFDNLLNGDFAYEVNTQRNSRLEKVFVQTRTGSGNFRYIGDTNNNGVKDEREFEPALYDGDYIVLTIPTEQLFPVIDLKTSMRIRLEHWSPAELTGILSFLRDISSETHLRADENTRDENNANVYLLKLSTFRDSINTIQGTGFYQQDIYLWEQSSELSFRFRFIDRKTFAQYSGGNERGRYNIRSWFVRFKLLREIGAELEYIITDDILSAPTLINRGRSISGNTVLADIFYRPYNTFETGIKISSTANNDSYLNRQIKADVISLTVRALYSLAAKGQIRTEFESTSVDLPAKDQIYPFELTNGNFPGRNYFWRFNFDYRISLNLQATVAYDGRKQGEGRVVHTGRAEMRAFF